MSLKKIMSLVKNLLIQLWETWEKNRTRESINEKSLGLDEEMWKKNRKIIDIINKKSF